VTYTFDRNGESHESTLIVAGPSDHVVRRRLFLEIIGLLYFLIGAIVLIKRFHAPHALHFYYVCLMSFVFYVFHYTGKLNAFDWTIFWLGLVAQTLLPALFLHFCLEFPVKPQWLARNGKRALLLYLPGVVLLAAWVVFVYWSAALALSPLL